MTKSGKGRLDKHLLPEMVMRSVPITRYGVKCGKPDPDKPALITDDTVLIYHRETLKMVRGVIPDWQP